MITASVNNNDYKIEFLNKEYSQGIINNSDFNIDLIKNNNNSYHVLYNKKSYNINIVSEDTEEKTILLKINNNSFNIKLTEEIDLLLKQMGIKNKSKQQKKELKAPMPGLVVNIPVNKGDKIKQGETLLVLEAMKMENNLKAEHDVTIKDISAEKGNSVEKNEVLILFE